MYIQVSPVCVRIEPRDLIVAPSFSITATIGFAPNFPKVVSSLLTVIAVLYGLFKHYEWTCSPLFAYLGTPTNVALSDKPSRAYLF